MKFEIDANIPAGYEPTGEYRPAKRGEWMLNAYGKAVDAWGDGGIPALIAALNVALGGDQ